MREEIPPGTLDMLILKTLSAKRELHGFEIADEIDRSSNGVFFVEEGSLYPALQRMLVKGWLNAEWGRTADNRRARYYRLSANGRKQLQLEIRTYQRANLAIARILQLAPEAT